MSGGFGGGDWARRWADPDDIPDDPHDPFWASRVADPMPEWIGEFRSWQLDATREIVDAYRRGVGVVCLDAPTGAGKTIIGEMVRRCGPLGLPSTFGSGPTAMSSTYVCHSINLQEQFQTDFQYARVLKGRSNYPTEEGPPWVTAADCEGKACGWCPKVCPYRVAKASALKGELAVVNTAYWLHEINHVREGLRGRAFTIIDEADVLESALMGFVEFKVTREMMRRAGVRGLKKGVRTPAIVEWCQDVSSGLKTWGLQNKKSLDVKVVRQATAALRLSARALEFAKELGVGGEDDAKVWVRQYVDRGWDEGAAIWKAVTVDRFGEEKVWRWCGGGVDAGAGGLIDANVLAMSATLISAEEWAESNGLEAAGVSWESVRVPSPFPVANRPIIAVPVADMGYKTWREDVGKLCTAIDVVLDKHPDDKVLIHSTSYQVGREIVDWLRGGHGTRTSRHAVITHGSGKGERETAVEQYRATRGPAVIVSPSLDRGVDLPGDLCRVQIIAKVPFASLGDRQVSERLRLPGGQTWYQTNTARTIVQMTGRGVRSVDDHATTYILDKQFHRWYRQAKRLLPGWWTDAVAPGRVTDFTRKRDTDR